MKYEFTFDELTKLDEVTKFRIYNEIIISKHVNISLEEPKLDFDDHDAMNFRKKSRIGVYFLFDYVKYSPFSIHEEILRETSVYKNTSISPLTNKIIIDEKTSIAYVLMNIGSSGRVSARVNEKIFGKNGGSRADFYLSGYYQRAMGFYTKSEIDSKLYEVFLINKYKPPLNKQLAYYDTLIYDEVIVYEETKKSRYFPYKKH